jgi:hypothetical protein
MKKRGLMAEAYTRNCLVFVVSCSGRREVCVEDVGDLVNMTTNVMSM